MNLVTRSLFTSYSIYHSPAPLSRTSSLQADVWEEFPKFALWSPVWSTKSRHWLIGTLRIVILSQGSSLKDKITKLSGRRTPITKWRCAIFQKKGDLNCTSEKSKQLAFALRSIVVFLRCICLWRVFDRKVLMVTAYSEWTVSHCVASHCHQNYVQCVTSSQGL